MTSPSAERHVLVIEHPDYEQAIQLEAVAYSVGRDKTNAIVLDVETLSRQHAILLRVPDPQHQSYSYRLVDGNAAGKASTNGVYINGKRCATHALGDGDQIQFGRKVKASYRRLKMEQQEFSEFLKSIEYQRLKVQQVDVRATLIADEMTGGFPKPPRQEVAAAVGAAANSPFGLTPGMGHAKLLMDDDLTVAGPATGHNLTEADLFGPAETKTDRPNFTETVHETEPSKIKPIWIGLVIGLVGLVALGLFGASRASQPSSQPIQPPAQSQTSN
jgi:pSer/pThr/pTyr-binding forkhead associated (FHA) protein